MLEQMKLKTKLVIAFLMCGLIPALIVGLIALKKASDGLKNAEFNKLTAIREIKKKQIGDFFEKNKVEIETLRDVNDLHVAYDSLLKYHNDTNVKADGNYGVKSDEYIKIHEEINSHFHNYVDKYGYFDVFLICAKHGHVMYSVTKEGDLGENLSCGRLRNSGLAKVWKKVIQAKETSFADFQYYEPSHVPAAFIGTPLTDKKSGELFGVLVFQVSLDKINDIMQEATGLGKTGETYLVGSDHLMRSDSRLDPKNHSVIASFANPKDGSVKTEATEEAFKGNSDAKIIEDYLGSSVLSAYTPLNILGEKWAIIAEVEEHEAFAVINNIQNIMIIVLIIVSIIIVICAVLFAKSAMKPIENTIAILKDIIETKDFNKRLPMIAQPCSDDKGCGNKACPEFEKDAACWDTVGSNAPKGDVHCPGVLSGKIKQCADCFVMQKSMQTEMGEFAGWFNTMLGMTSNIIRETQKVAVDVKHSSMDSASSATQLAASVEEMTAQVATVSSAAEEMSASVTTTAASAEEMGVNAKTVATNSESIANDMNNMSAAVEEGQVNLQNVAAATEEMSATVNEIATNAESARTVATSAVESVSQAQGQIGALSDASKEIEKVIETIVDIADQTKLLALNATIEAARAGEAGKGFAVVAGEVKELAKQTNDATNDIRTKIEAMQKATGSTVTEISSIDHVIKDVNEIVSTIAAAIEEQNVTMQENAENINQASQGMNEVAETVSGINTSVTEMSQNIGEIATGAEDVAKQSSEVSNGVADVTENISGINSGTAESADVAQKVSVSSEQLSEMADKLEKLVNQFQV